MKTLFKSKKKLLEEVVAKIDGVDLPEKPSYVRFMWDSEFAFRFKFEREYYDGPFWQLQIGKFWVFWNIQGLPYLFWKKQHTRK